ncbi:MAG: cation diffusion facilitator family transporter [Clostridia bacterium]|nr:cation diffusion facilitator family transporter [Clostridia bacterium]MDD4386264.1 cation diffusion facilitator family transporter [Clostridia bacterium]
MNRYNDTKKVSILGIIANLFLFIIKIVVAITSRSQGLLADAINSGTDIFTSVMTYIGNKLASKPGDREHPYGHGKVEYVFSLIISICMIFLSYKILINSYIAIVEKKELVFSFYLIAVCVITIIVKLFLYIYTIKMTQIHENLLISAASEDHRNDMFLSLATLIGIVCSKYGLYYIDGIVGVIISIWIAYVAIKLFLSAYCVLIDTDINDGLKEKIVNVIRKCDNCEIDSIKSSPVGVNYILLIEISVEEDFTLEEGHAIAEKIKKEVCKLEKIVDAIIHVNPKI